MDKRIKVNLDLLKKLYVVDGLSGRKCAELLNVSKSAVLKFTKRYGWSRPNIQNTDSFGRFVAEQQVLPPATGENHFRWKGGVGTKTYRRIAFSNHGDSCEHCGSKDNISVHHVNKNRKNNDPTNLKVVCQKCHMIIYHPDNLAERSGNRDEYGRFI